MAFFCIESFIAGVFNNHVAPRVYIYFSELFFMGGLILSSSTGQSIIMLYLGFSVLFWLWNLLTIL
ncbi:MAG: hypothetical protein HUJ51_06115 [Eggerthellaceae bacterium]|nr:hypothetical protein [Eggerthellaceae bacterium]